MNAPEHGHEILPLYDAIGGPLYAVHANGLPYAAFSGPNPAATYMRGLDARGRSIFHLENADGQRVTLGGHYGHASAIVAGDPGE